MVLPNLTEPLQKKETRTHYSYTKNPGWEVQNGQIVGFKTIRDDNKPGTFRLNDWSLNGEIRKGYYTLLEEGKIFDVVQEGDKLTFKLKYDPKEFEHLKVKSLTAEELEA